MIRVPALLLFFSMAVQAIAADLPEPVTDNDYRAYSPELVKLGQLLFYDRVLSGTYRVSCATCHNLERASSNGFRLDGKLDKRGDTLAINGLPLYEALKPSSEHAPALFNLGAMEFTNLFSDGRVEENGNAGFLSPAGDKLPSGLADVLAVQVLFPAVNVEEFVGKVENEIAAVAHLGEPAIWNAVAARVQSVEEYLPYFRTAFPDVKAASDIGIVHIANAIGAFVGTEWRSDNSPFDAYLRGDENALSVNAKRGMELFYGKSGCSTCHTGKFQTDHKFHSVGLPVWRFDLDLAGTESAKLRNGRVMGSKEGMQSFAYRTPSLRNVAKTAPYGQAGSYGSLKDFMRDHLQSNGAAGRFVDERLKGGRKASGELIKIIEALDQQSQIKSVELNDDEVEDLLSFLRSLTDEKSLEGRFGRPDEVPSGLALD